jgi:ATP-dependent DNA helicase DinG
MASAARERGCVAIAGRGLELVILDNLPSPVPTEPGSAATYRKTGRAPGDVQWGAFRPFTLPSVVTTLKQVVGHLIRSPADKGVVAIRDRRIVEKSFGKPLVTALPPLPLTSDVAEAQRVFAAGSTGNGREPARPRSAGKPPRERGLSASRSLAGR